MIRRCIGIEVGRTYVRAVQMARTPEGLVIEKAFGVQARRSTDSVSRILRSLMTDHGFDRRAQAAVSMPAQAVSFVEIRTDAAGLQALRDGQTLTLRDDLPLAVEDAVIQVCSTRALPKDKYGILVAAASAEMMREQLHSLHEAGIRPVAVDAPIIGTHQALATNHPEVMIGTALILCVDASVVTLAVTKDGNLLIVRNIPMFCDEPAEISVRQTAEILEREIEITWRKLFGAAPDETLYVLLVAPPKAAEPLVAAIRERIECRIVVADPYAKVKRSGDIQDPDLPVCAAEGLALQALSPESAERRDLLAAYHGRTRRANTARKELITVAVLIAATAAVWFIGLFIRLSTLESQYGRLKDQILDVFHQALPQERNVVDPLAQLQQKIDAFHKDDAMSSAFRPGRLSPLDVWSTLTTHVPGEGNLRFQDLLITADSAQVIGTCDSFAVVSDWQRTVRQAGGFGNVDIKDQKKDARTGQVRFTLSMASARREP